MKKERIELSAEKQEVKGGRTEGFEEGCALTKTMQWGKFDWNPSQVLTPHPTHDSGELKREATDSVAQLQPR